MTRKILRVVCVCTLATSFVAVSVQASVAPHPKTNQNVKSVPLPAPDLKSFELEEQMVASNITPVKNTAMRKIAADSSKITGSEDLMTPELKAFRDKLLKTRHAEQLEPLLREYDAKYDTLPNDLKYVVARLSPMLAFRGFFWRMATLAHQAVISQEVLLGMVRSFGEQVMLFEPDAQWQAYLTYLSIPSPGLLAPGADKNDGVKRPDQRFYIENDLSDFMATDVYTRLDTAIKRLAKLQTTVTINGKTTPVVFDNRIRFGEDAFNQSYDALDRFSIIGEAERFAAMAKFHRRLATISQLVAYNLNGNIALRRTIGKKFGIDATLGSAASEDALSVDGVTRSERVSIARSHPHLFSLRSKEWMKMAYYHLSFWVDYAGKAWEHVEHDRDNYDMLLDPELFVGRRDQIDKAIANLRQMLPNPKENSVATIHGAVSGDELKVNLKNFFYSPPDDLKALMPTQFNHRHEDAQELTKVYGADNIKFSPKSTVAMKIDLNGRKHEIEWRDYLFGRATGWDPAVYNRLFPTVSSPEDVARAQRILNETRGARPLLNTLTVFVK